MSLSYFYGKTNLGTDIIRDQWTYNASTAKGNFTANSSADIISQPVSGTYYEDFSLFVTFDKLNKKAVALFSNSSEVAGFDLGVDQNNFLFLKTKGQTYTFDEITLGRKNTIAFQKAGNAFTILHFDPHSAGITQSQTVLVDPSVNLAGNSYKFGALGLSIGGVSNFYGTVDQLLFLSEKVSYQDALTIFFGFSALPVATTVSASYEVIAKDWYVTSPDFSTAIKNYIESYLTSYYMGVVVIEELVEAESSYIGQVSFDNEGTVNYSVSNYFGFETDAFCRTGNEPMYLMGDVIIHPTIAGLPSKFIIKVNFSVGPDETRGAHTLSTEYFFTFDLSEIYPGTRFTATYAIKWAETTTVGTNADYAALYAMEGVLVPESDYTTLITKYGRFDQIGLESSFNSIDGYFYTTGLVQGNPVYLNGEQVSYTVNDQGRIDITDYEETNADVLIYDLVNSGAVLKQNPTSFATGTYNRMTSFVTTGNSVPLRIRESEYLETHPYHLYHNKSWQDYNSASILDNSQAYWGVGFTHDPAEGPPIIANYVLKPEDEENVVQPDETPVQYLA